jgi:DNA-directed RNA polymerase subunit RPC12/RpoP
MIKKIKVNTFIERLYCDKCKNEMKKSREALTFPVTYIYHCVTCGNETPLNTLYPNILYEKINE